MNPTARSLRFRALAVLLAAPAILAAQRATIATPKIHETKDAVYVTIDVPKSTMTCATGIAPGGKIVGVYRTRADANQDPLAYDDTLGFLLEGNTFSTILYDGPKGLGYINGTFPMKINARGDIAGWWINRPDWAPSETGWLLQNGKFSAVNYTGDLPPEVGPGPMPPQITDVVGITSSGDMAGQLTYLVDSVNVRNNRTHGWFYDNAKRQFSYFDVPGALTTFVQDVNDRGDIVGEYVRQTGDAIEIRGFLRNRDGAFQDTVVPSDWQAEGQNARAINAAGVIVGEYFAGGGPHG